MWVESTRTHFRMVASLYVQCQANSWRSNSTYSRLPGLHNGIVLLSLLTNTYHCMQPLDFTYFEPLETSYNRKRDLYMTSNLCQKFKQYGVVQLYIKIFNRISNIKKIADGFQQLVFGKQGQPTKNSYIQLHHLKIPLTIYKLHNINIC